MEIVSVLPSLSVVVPPLRPRSDEKLSSATAVVENDCTCRRESMQHISPSGQRRSAKGNTYSPFPGKGCGSSDRSKRHVSSTQVQQHLPHARSSVVTLAATAGDGASSSAAMQQQTDSGSRRDVVDPRTQTSQLLLFTPPPARVLCSSSPESSQWHISITASPSVSLLVSSPLPDPTGDEECLPSLSGSPAELSTLSDRSYLYLYKKLPRVSSETDYDRLGRSMRALQEACFYYQDLDSDSARALLEKAPEGTFLVRDSSDAKFLFAITVKTAKGATSVRIQYYRGFFQLDCEDQMKRKLPR